jgi:uncharacterized delta-60 repeat protein
MKLPRSSALVLLAALGVVSSGLASGAASAAAGGLDPAFGTGGEVVTSTNYNGSAPPAAVLLQPDGKIVVIAQLTDPATVGDFGVIRYQASGALDTSFGTGGEARTAFTNFINGPNDAALQPDGKIVVVGDVSSADGTLNEFGVVRFNSNGTLDSTFGTGGKVTTNFVGVQPGGVSNPAEAVLIQPDGKILVGGSASESPRTGTKTALARYNPNGTLDTSFGTGGTVSVTAIGQVQTLGEDAAGDIFAASNAGAIAEFSSAGALQPQVTASPITVASARGFSPVLQANGSYLVGQSVAGANRHDGDAQVVRHLPTGTVDPGFTNPPFDYTAEGTVAQDSIQGLAVQPGGQVVVTGIHTAAGAAALEVARLTSSGGLDATFGTGGIASISLPGQGNVVAIQPDGKIVVAGELEQPGSPPELVLLRFLGQ